MWIVLAYEPRVFPSSLCDGLGKWKEPLLNVSRAGEPRGFAPRAENRTKPLPLTTTASLWKFSSSFIMRTSFFALLEEVRVQLKSSQRYTDLQWFYTSFAFGQCLASHVFISIQNIRISERASISHKYAHNKMNLNWARSLSYVSLFRCCQPPEYVPSHKPYPHTTLLDGAHQIRRASVMFKSFR